MVTVRYGYIHLFSHFSTTNFGAFQETFRFLAVGDYSLIFVVEKLCRKSSVRFTERVSVCKSIQRLLSQKIYFTPDLSLKDIFAVVYWCEMSIL